MPEPEDTIRRALNAPGPPIQEDTDDALVALDVLLAERQQDKETIRLLSEWHAEYTRRYPEVQQLREALEQAVEWITCPRCEGQKHDVGSCALCGNLGVLDKDGLRFQQHPLAAEYQAEIGRLRKAYEQVRGERQQLVEAIAHVLRHGTAGKQSERRLRAALAVVRDPSQGRHQP